MSVRKGYAAPEGKEAKGDLPKGLPPELGRAPQAAAADVRAAARGACGGAAGGEGQRRGDDRGRRRARRRSRRRATRSSTPSTSRSCRWTRAGKTHGLAQGHPQLTMPQATADAVVANGLRLSHRLTLAPGAYQLRIAVREAGGGGSGVGVVRRRRARPGEARAPDDADRRRARRRRCRFRRPTTTRC